MRWGAWGDGALSESIYGGTFVKESTKFRCQVTLQNVIKYNAVIQGGCQNKIPLLRPKY